MKKILYLSHIDFNDKYKLGVIKKINEQINAFKALGYKIDIIYTKKGIPFFNNQIIAKNKQDHCKKHFIN